MCKVRGKLMINRRIWVVQHKWILRMNMLSKCTHVWGGKTVRGGWCMQMRAACASVEPASDGLSPTLVTLHPGMCQEPADDVTSQTAVIKQQLLAMMWFFLGTSVWDWRDGRGCPLVANMQQAWGGWEKHAPGIQLQNPFLSLTNRDRSLLSLLRFN